MLWKRLNAIVNFTTDKPLLLKLIDMIQKFEREHKQNKNYQLQINNKIYIRSEGDID